LISSSPARCSARGRVQNKQMLTWWPRTPGTTVHIEAPVRKTPAGHTAGERRQSGPRAAAGHPRQGRKRQMNWPDITVSRNTPTRPAAASSQIPCSPSACATSSPMKRKHRSGTSTLEGGRHIRLDGKTKVVVGRKKRKIMCFWTCQDRMTRLSASGISPARSASFPTRG